jgi:phenylacetate-CoA ligase
MKVWLKATISRFLRRGPLFYRLLAELQANETKNSEKLWAMQEQRLQQIVTHAAKHVPFYRDLFAQLGVEPTAIGTLQDLSLLPLIDKWDVQGRETQFVSQTYGFKIQAHSGGTTGTPMRVYRDRFSIVYEHANHWRQWLWTGFTFGDRRATLRGGLIVPTEQQKPPFWRYVAPEKQLRMSIFHLSNICIPDYLKELRRFQPHAMEGYPSALYRLARYMEQHNEQPILVKAVFTSSEKLFDHQRVCLEAQFGPVFDTYGNTERVAYIAQCEHGRYHIASDYSVTEFLPRDNGLHEVVGTTLHNKVMPLLRYATGDLVKLSDVTCLCGRTFPLAEEIYGRHDDYIITPTGRWVGRIGPVFYNSQNVTEGQIIQESLDHVRVRLVTTPAFTSNDERILCANLISFLGPEIQITVEKTPEIKRTGNGKYKLVISKVNKHVRGACRINEFLEQHER